MHHVKTCKDCQAICNTSIKLNYGDVSYISATKRLKRAKNEEAENLSHKKETTANNGLHQTHTHTHTNTRTHAIYFEKRG